MSSSAVVVLALRELRCEADERKGFGSLSGLGDFWWRRLVSERLAVLRGAFDRLDEEGVALSSTRSVGGLGLVSESVRSGPGRTNAADDMAALPLALLGRAGAGAGASCALALERLARVARVGGTSALWACSVGSAGSGLASCEGALRLRDGGGGGGGCSDAAWVPGRVGGGGP